MVNSNLFIVDNVIRIILKVPSIRILLAIGSINLSEGHPKFLSNFPFVNLRRKSIVESLRALNKWGKIQCSQIYAFWGKVIFRNLHITPNFLV